MNEAEFAYSQRIVMNSVLRQFLDVALSNLHSNYDYYFRQAFQPGNGHTVPFFHSPVSRKDAIGWFSQTYENIGQALGLLEAKYVE